MQRLAYLIGNADYNNDSLTNPINDVYTMKEKLEKCGFRVETYKNLYTSNFKDVIYEFKNTINEYDTGLFYFAGHGFEFNGRNYLVPCDCKELDDAIDITNLIKIMSTKKDFTSIVILDCCRTDIAKSRNNIPAKELSRFEFNQGVFISFATSPNSSASDGIGKNGLFTEVLSKHLLEEGLKIEELFKKVRKEVIEKSNFRQVPWEHSSLVGDFYFVPPKISVKDFSKNVYAYPYIDIKKKVKALWEQIIKERGLSEVITSESELLTLVLNEIDAMYFDERGELLCLE